MVGLSPCAQKVRPNSPVLTGMAQLPVAGPKVVAAVSTAMLFAPMVVLALSITPAALTYFTSPTTTNPLPAIQVLAEV